MQVNNHRYPLRSFSLEPPAKNHGSDPRFSTFDFRLICSGRQPKQIHLSVLISPKRNKGFELVEQTGFEPVSPGLQSGALTIFATIPWWKRQDSNLHARSGTWFTVRRASQLLNASINLNNLFLCRQLAIAAELMLRRAKESNLRHGFSRGSA